MRNEIKTESGIEKDLDVIKDDLKESQLIDTAYYCDYEMIKLIDSALSSGTEEKVEW
jgi:hypothetical protein